MPANPLRRGEGSVRQKVQTHGAPSEHELQCTSKHLSTPDLTAHRQRSATVVAGTEGGTIPRTTLRNTHPSAYPFLYVYLCMRVHVSVDLQ